MRRMRWLANGNRDQTGIIPVARTDAQSCALAEYRLAARQSWSFQASLVKLSATATALPSSPEPPLPQATSTDTATSTPMTAAPRLCTATTLNSDSGAKHSPGPVFRNDPWAVEHRPRRAVLLSSKA